MKEPTPTPIISITPPNGSIYKPLEPIKKFEPPKPFEPLKPFEPIKPFEPLKPFEPPKSFELAKQIEASISPQSAETQNQANVESQSLTEQNSVFCGELPADYEPVVALEPLKPYDPLPPLNPPQPINFGSDNSSLTTTYTNNVSVSKSKETLTKAEIEDGKAKNTLKEIISEIDMYAEKDKELKPVEKNEQESLNNKESYNEVRCFCSSS